MNELELGIFFMSVFLTLFVSAYVCYLECCIIRPAQRGTTRNQREKQFHAFIKLQKAVERRRRLYRRKK